MEKNDILFLNKYGVPEPIKSNRIIPNVALVPLLAFDKYKNRLDIKVFTINILIDI